jgi:hypothetical protein
MWKAYAARAVLTRRNVVTAQVVQGEDGSGSSVFLEIDTATRLTVLSHTVVSVVV